MARKKHGDDGGGYNWMDTYGDMVTLLLTFFIMLFSMSTVDEGSWQTLVQSFSKSAPDSPQQIALPMDGETGDKAIDSKGEYDLLVKKEIDLEHERPVTVSELYDYLKAYIDAEGMADSVNIQKDAMNNVYMRFDNNIFFASDSAILREESYPILQFMGECIKAVEDQIYVVRVVGHTAAVAQKDYPINDWDLSSSRANQVVNFFEENSKFDSQKLMSNGYGKNRPRFSNVTAEGRAKNRRVEIMILGNEINTSDPEQLLNLLQQMTDMQIEESPENSTGILKGDEAPEQVPSVGSIASGTTPNLTGKASQSDAAQSGAAQSNAAQSDAAQSDAAQGTSQSTETQNAQAQSTVSQAVSAGAASAG